jgi:hypothetical protein
LLLALTGLFLLGISGAILYKHYLDHIDPSVMYGSWVEVQVPKARQETLTFTSKSVLRNNHFVASKFNFDGSDLYFETGEGTFLYRWNGSLISPQLERRLPENPVQRFIKKGYEDTLETHKTNKIGL